MREVDRGALEALSALLLERAGLKITPDGHHGLRRALLARMPSVGQTDAAEYVRRLGLRSGEAELKALLPLVTVGKTEFFRDQKQLLAFARQVLPELLITSGRAERALKVWSAGCATGEEPYSLAMAAAEQGARAGAVDIWATDLNPVATETAQRGLYAPRRLAGLSPQQIRRFFRHVDGHYRVSDPLRALVRFETHNLAAPLWPQVPNGCFDAIFCRNVIIYFDPGTIELVLSRFYEALRPGGWLFLGYAESLFRVSTRFEMVDLDGTFAYRRPLVRRARLRPEPSGPVPAPARRQARPPAPPRMPPEPLWTVGERLGHVVRAMETGDFPVALRLAKKLVDDAPLDLAARLTLGNLYILLGSREEARQAFAAALAQEPLCLEARLFLGVAALGAGHLDEAKTELKGALFLEPSLPLGHYLLGLVHERKHEIDAARRAYRNAARHGRTPSHQLLGYFPDLPKSDEAIAQLARYRLAALSEQE